MNDVPTILDDTRKIDSIWLPDDEEGPQGFWIGASEKSAKFCHEIRAYAENGQCASVPFFAIYRDGQIISRVPAHMVSVNYA